MGRNHTYNQTRDCATTKPPPATSRLFSVSGTFGDVQIVATRDCVVLDLETHHARLADLAVQHALANLTLGDAIRLHGILGDAISVACEDQHHQPCLWPTGYLRRHKVAAG